MSEDGQFGFSIIALIGSVFSPYYAWAERQHPQDHIAINVGLYGKGVKTWTMTERGHRALSQSPHHLEIGPSTLVWDGENLTITIDENAAPFPRRVRGQIRVTPRGLTKKAYRLDHKGRHFWHPIAPTCNVECVMSEPGIAWKGHGYIDSNWGSEPLEAGFSHWDWSRCALDDGAGILYDAFLADGENRQLILRFDQQGNVREAVADRRLDLPKCPIWRMPRTTLIKQDHVQETVKPTVVSTFEDTPFYSRSKIATFFEGEPCIAMHESLDLSQFAKPWVRFLLPFRMPRRV